MNHNEIEACMADYLEGDLPLNKRAVFDAHLDTCSECSEELRAMRGVVSALKNLPCPEVPSDFANEVMRRVRAGEGRTQWWDQLSAWLQELFVPRFAVPATAVATALVISVMTGQIQVPTTPGSDHMADQRPRIEVSIKIEGVDPTRASDPMEGFAGPGQVTFKSLQVDGNPWNARSGAPNVSRIRNVSQQAALGAEIANSGTVRWASAVAPGAFDTHAFESSGGRGEERRYRASRTLGWERALAPSTASAPSREEVELRSQMTLDELLRRMELAPVNFARRQAQLTVAEQELWARQLAHRASELGQLAEFTQLLQSSGDPYAGSLAKQMLETEQSQDREPRSSRALPTHSGN